MIYELVIWIFKYYECVRTYVFIYFKLILITLLKLSCMYSYFLKLAPVGSQVNDEITTLSWWCFEQQKCSKSSIRSSWFRVIILPQTYIIYYNMMKQILPRNNYNTVGQVSRINILYNLVNFFFLQINAMRCNAYSCAVSAISTSSLLPTSSSFLAKASSSVSSKMNL